MRCGDVWQRMAEPGSARLGEASPRTALHGTVMIFAGLGCAARRLARHRHARLGKVDSARRCEARLGAATLRMARLGKGAINWAGRSWAGRRQPWNGSARHGRAKASRRDARRGNALPANARHGNSLAGQRGACPRLARQRSARVNFHGWVWLGRAWQRYAPPCSAGLGPSSHGMVKVFVARCGCARLGCARQRSARRVEAWERSPRQGVARHG